FTDGLCADGAGGVYFSDLPSGIIYHVGAEGQVRPWLEEGLKVSGMGLGQEKLYAAVQGRGEGKTKSIVAIDLQTKAIEVMATRVDPNDLIVSKAGFLYFTDTKAGSVARLPLVAREMSRPPTVAAGINRPNGIGLNADETALLVSEHGGDRVWSFPIGDHGELLGGERLMTLRRPEADQPARGDGLATDRESRSYVTSKEGIQVFDHLGHSLGILAPPTSDKPVVSCGFGGSWLYVCHGDRVYRRKTSTSGH
ncbi:MAG: SMP-30/gluconolactonase/LRE family protein, partial [Verrucomicrobiota bacterium]